LRLAESNRALSPARSHELRDSIRMILVSGLAITALFAISLAYWYAWTIKRPVSRLAENSRLLALREPLLPSLGGNDELARLDHTFHVVAATIYSALAREKAMIENAADLICTMNNDGIFLSTNAYSEIILHMSPGDLVGKS